MSNNHSASASRSHGDRSTLLVLARIGAVLLALAVVAYLIYNAQARADGDSGSVAGEAQQPVGGDAAVKPASGLGDVLLPSSKFRVITDGAFFNDGGDPQPPEMAKQDLMVLPSSKSLVLDPGTVKVSHDPALLFSSKFGPPIPAPVESKDANAEPKTPKQAVKGHK